MTFKNDEYYEGDWKNDLREGEGLFHWPNGQEFKGSYLNDLKEGPGSIFWAIMGKDQQLIFLKEKLLVQQLDIIVMVIYMNKLIKMVKKLVKRKFKKEGHLKNNQQQKEKEEKINILVCSKIQTSIIKKG